MFKKNFDEEVELLSEAINGISIIFKLGYYEEAERCFNDLMKNFINNLSKYYTNNTDRDIFRNGISQTIIYDMSACFHSTLIRSMDFLKNYIDYVKRTGLYDYYDFDRYVEIVKITLNSLKEFNKVHNLLKKKSDD